MRISRRRRLYRYTVSIYLVDDAIESPMSDRFSIPLIKLFSGTIAAEHNRMAATQVWIDKVGQFRRQELDDLGAPLAIRDADIDPHAVAKQLVPSSLCPDSDGFLLDYRAEAWLIGVKEAS